MYRLSVVTSDTAIKYSCCYATFLKLNEMKIFIIGHDDWGYDCYSDFVIVANDETEVRAMAIKMAADEGREPWETAKITEEGLYTGKETDPFCLLASFHAG